MTVTGWLILVPCWERMQMAVELTFLGLVGRDVRADVAFELLRPYAYDCCDWSGARRQPEASPT